MAGEWKKFLYKLTMDRALIHILFIDMIEIQLKKLLRPSYEINEKIYNQHHLHYDMYGICG